MRRLIRLSALIFVLIAGLSAWYVAKLTRHPVSLDFLLPQLHAALKSDPGGAMVQVGGLELAWDPTAHRPEVRALDVEVAGDNVGMQLSVHAIALHVRLRALLSRRLEIAAVDVIEPHVTVKRRSSGAIEIGGSDSAATTPAESGQSQRWLSVVLSKPDDLPKIARLDRLSIRHGAITLSDESSGRDYNLTGLDFSIWRKGEDLGAQLHFDVEADDKHAEARAALSYQRRAKLIALNVDGKNIFLPAFAGLAPQLEGLQMPLDLHVDLATDDLLQMRSLQVEAHGGPGRLQMPGVEQSVSADGLNLHVDLDPQAHRLEVANFGLTLDGVTIDAHGAVDSSAEERAVTAEVHVAEAPTRSVIRNWPANAAPQARKWVAEHISGGTLHDVGVRLAGHVPSDGWDFSFEKLEGAFKFSGVEASFLDGFPAARKIEGAGGLSLSGLQFMVRSGRLLDVDVSSGNVAIAGFGSKPTIEIDANASGSLAAVLTVLDAPRFGFATAMGVQPADTSGNVSANVKLAFPLDKSPTMDALGLVLKGSARDAAAPSVGGYKISGANLDVALNGASLRVEGDLKAQDVPAHLLLTQVVDRPSSRSISVAARLDRHARATLGVDPGSWLDGPVAVEVRSGASDQKGDRWDVDVDLRDASISVLAPAVSKAASLPGRAQARLRVNGGQLTAVESFEVNFARTSISGSATRAPANWQTANAKVAIDGPVSSDTPGRLVALLRPGGRRAQLTVTSEDAGQIAHALEIGDAKGGRLMFSSEIDLQGPGLPFDGVLQVDNFAITRAPVLARLLNLASMSGIVASFSGEGLPFDRLVTKLSYHPELLTFSDFLLNGGQVVMTGNGTVNPSLGRIDAQGTLIPSYYGLNQGASKIPFVGRLVDRVTGGAIQAFDFKLKGPLRDPEMKIEPSSMMPGALRDLLRPLQR
ncbi:MAG TPA: DUF3971 domain-containing protein [Candidatus Acidoferrales bacterium]|nr:DUF3971 domain-containing protein [Candidatus Acidoferrales bacterium]